MRRPVPGLRATRSRITQRLAAAIVRISPTVLVMLVAAAPPGVGHAQEGGYAIVVSDEVRARSAMLEPFIAHKKARGFAISVGGDAELAAAAGADRADRVRAWLRSESQRAGLRYVLIVGNPDPAHGWAPMKRTVPDGSVTPTDHYFADLTGNWDLDGDGQVAEYPDDGGAGGVDFAAAGTDVRVGRIPLYGDADSVAVLDEVLARTIRYETAPDASRGWRGRVLQAAAWLSLTAPDGDGTDGAELAARLGTSTIEPRGLEQHRLYETAGARPSRRKPDAALSRESLRSALPQGYGLVHLIGGGDASSLARLVWLADANGDQSPDPSEVDQPTFFSYDDLVVIDHERPAIVLHPWAANATPEQATNLAFGLLRFGAAATISSTRAPTIDAPGSVEALEALVRELTTRLLDGASVGEALFGAKSAVSDDLGVRAWLTRLQVNLYGDPSLRLSTCARDADCDDDKLCNGRETCAAGQCQPGVAVPCTAADPCEEATCSEQTGRCTRRRRPENERCDDGMFCTIDDRCVSGLCVGAPRCAATNPCLRAACDESARRCDVFALLDVDRVCNAGTGREGVCDRGVCVPLTGSGCKLGHDGGGHGSTMGWLLLGLLAAIAFVRRPPTKRKAP